MGRYLRGYFAGKPNCRQYRVDIFNDKNAEKEEIILAGDSPFVVTYDTSNTPFEPIRFSRASINVVADEKFLDVFSSEAQGTYVEVRSGYNFNTFEWGGYLTTNLLNMPEISCGAETFTLEAQDALSTLENYNYALIGEKKSIVSLQQVLRQIAIRCDRYAAAPIAFLDIDTSLGSTHKVDGYPSPYTSYPENLYISEQNFFSSDTDEPWNLREVLEEVCRYFGLTAIQFEQKLLLTDYQAHADVTWVGESFTTPYQYYRYSYTNTLDNPFSNRSTINSNAGGNAFTLSQDLIRGTGADISLEPIYNKIQVKDSFYEIDHFVPDIYEDNLLTNKLGEFWRCNQVGNSKTYKYINKKGKSAKEESNEADHVYYVRKFNHQDYTSIYRDKNTLAEIPEPEMDGYTRIQVSNTSKDLKHGGSQGGQYCYATLKATFTNLEASAHTIDIYYYLKTDRYQTYYNVHSAVTTTSSATITLAANATQNYQVSLAQTWGNYMLYYGAEADILYSVDGGPQKSVFEPATSGTTDVVSAVITDLATFDKPMSNTKYLYETESNIKFDRYLTIHQCDRPNRLSPYGYWNGMSWVETPYDEQIETYFPAVFKLNSGYTNPMIFTDNAYLYLDASAIYERYNAEWINPDWTHENSAMNGLGLFRKTSSIQTSAPQLIFKLKIGDKYWSSLSGWTTTDSCFVVNLSTDKTDSDDVDFTAWWNEEHRCLNNVSWSEWAGAKGYKIPLQTGMDMSQPITFQVHLPSKMQKVSTEYSHDGMNNYCWIKDLKLNFTTRDSENYDTADVLYENIIDSGSVNTLSDVTCKLTTYPGNGMHSYSTIGGYNKRVLTGIKKTAYDNDFHKPEELIIMAYTNQYKTPTVKQTMTLPYEGMRGGDGNYFIGPLSRFKDLTLDKYFTILGQTIDYANGSQEVTMIESKPYSE